MAAVPRAALVLAFVLALALPAAAYVANPPVKGDLDGDGDSETVRTVRVDVKGVANRFDRTKVEVEDTCEGAPLARRIAGPQDNLANLKLKNVDRRAGREVFADLRSGAAGRVGEARVVAWRSCAPRNLFRYLSERPTRRPRGATGDVATFLISVREISRRRPGLEIALDERFLGRSDPPCCGSFSKVTYWRYDADRDRYVRFRSKVSWIRFRR